MLSRTTINIIRKSMCSNARTFYYVRNSLQSNFLTQVNGKEEYDIQNYHNLYMVKRFKSNRRKIADNVINNTYIYIYIFLFS